MPKLEAVHCVPGTELDLARLEMTDQGGEPEGRRIPVQDPHRSVPRGRHADPVLVADAQLAQPSALLAERDDLRRRGAVEVRGDRLHQRGSDTNRHRVGRTAVQAATSGRVRDHSSSRVRRRAPVLDVWRVSMTVFLCDRCGDVTVNAEPCRCANAAAIHWPAHRPDAVGSRAGRPPWRTRPEPADLEPDSAVAGQALPS